MPLIIKKKYKQENKTFITQSNKGEKMSNEKIKVGSKAPLFEAIADNGEKISLANYIGKYNIVLYFYPKDFTPGCTKEACSFRDNWDKLKDYNAIVIGISSDNLETHKRFKEKYKIPFILLSDSKKEIRKKYNAEGFIFADRVTFVIDKNGIIRSIYKSQFNIEAHINNALETLKSLSVKNESK